MQVLFDSRKWGYVGLTTANWPRPGCKNLSRCSSLGCFVPAAASFCQHNDVMSVNCSDLAGAFEHFNDLSRPHSSVGLQMSMFKNWAWKLIVCFEYIYIYNSFYYIYILFPYCNCIFLGVHPSLDTPAPGNQLCWSGCRFLAGAIFALMILLSGRYSQVMSHVNEHFSPHLLAVSYQLY